MHVSFLPYLVDPATQEPLQLAVEKREGDIILEGTLYSSSHRYPIVRGIPRFAGYNESANYARSFGYQWQKWSRVQFESENRGRHMEGHTLRMWERITGIETQDLHGAVIADFGCGPGRFIEIVRMKNGKAIGLDLSEAVEAAAENFQGDPNVLICQADVLNPPIRTRSVDGAFSIGVFHHTPDPAGGFAAMARTVRPGGWTAVCVYGKGGYYDFPTVTLYRKLFKLLWPICKHYAPLIYAHLTVYLLSPIARIPLVGKLVKGFFPFICLPDVRWSILDTFDSVTPSYQSAHEAYEVFQWLKTNGLVEIETSNWGFATYNGRIPECEVAVVPCAEQTATAARAGAR